MIFAATISGCPHKKSGRVKTIQDAFGGGGHERAGAWFHSHRRNRHRSSGRRARARKGNGRRPPRRSVCVSGVRSYRSSKFGRVECVAEGDCLEPAIVRCNKIETHKTFSATNKTNGVRRTTSARAVRSSRDTEAKGSAPNKRPLAPRHSTTGQVPGLSRASTTEPASKRNRSTRGREFACAHRVAIECLH